MFATSDPNLLIGGMATGGLALAALWKLVTWIRDAPVRPDPWDGEVENQLQAAPEICPHCSTPQPPTAWFCEHCGRAVGPYNNLMPYLQVFSEGEVFRNGASGQFRRRPLILAGYFLLGFGMLSFLAPIYWFSLLLNLRSPETAQEAVPEEKTQ
jgi:hypothetical protein